MVQVGNPLLSLSVARAMWNNLLEPVGHKTSKITPNAPFLCPSEELPYLATALNSASAAPSPQAAMQTLASDYKAMVEAVGAEQCPL